MDPSLLPELLQTWGYPALLALLLLTGVGSPIPEDILLLTAGYLVFTGVLWWPLVVVVCIVGVVGSDLILYGAGRRLGWRSARGPEITSARLARATRLFDRLGPAVVFVARLVPGSRALVFITAGARALPASRFLLFDVLGALLWVPLLLAFGHAFGDNIGSLEDAVARLRAGAVWVIAAAVGLLVLWLVWGREESKL